MNDIVFRMLAKKATSMTLVNLHNGEDLVNVQASGSIMKGRLAAEPRVLADGRRRTDSIERYFTGELISHNLPGDQVRISVIQNPSVPSTGFEESLNSTSDYPAIQVFDVYAVFTFQVPDIAVNQMNRRFGQQSTVLPERLFPMANRQDTPIRVSATISQEWGLDPHTEYVLQDDMIPLWPWNWDTQDFFTLNPVTGGRPIPCAFLRKAGDSVRMVRTWRLEKGQWVMRD